MADIKISELTQVSELNNEDLIEVSQVNALAPSGYTSLKASMTNLGNKVNKDIEYTTDLADFTDKTTLGAIKETAKDKNVADEYDDTQTYDKGDVVIYKNTLYICTTNNTTGTWDSTKWTATTVQSLIGSLSQLTTTDKSSLVGAVNEVNANASNLCKHIVLQHLTNDYTFTATSQTRIFAEEENITLTKGKYLFEVTLPAIWTNSSGVIHGGIRLNTTYTESSMIYGPEQMSGLLSFRGVMTVGANTTYKLSSAFRTDSSKPLTVKAYVSPTITLWKVNESN